LAHIDDLVKQVGDPQLRAALMQQVSTLTSRKQFGLVFQEHSPESVRLSQQRVRTGDKVQLRESKESATFHVISTKASLDVATVVELDESGETVGEPHDMLKADLVVVKPFGDPVYPGLRQIGEAGAVKSGQPTHVVINGENFHALQALEYTHASKVDVIYIDPPYNTGNDSWKYNDNYVDNDDAYRHSKWLSFMEKRLKIAKALLTEEGVVFISIGEDENARLKLLCDSVLGEQNFITNFVWEKTQHFGRQKVNSYSNADFILAYGKNLRNNGVRETLVEKVKSEFEDAPLYNRSNPINTLTFAPGTVKVNLKDGVYSESTDEKYVLESPVIVRDGNNVNPLVLSFRSRWSQKRVTEEIGKGSSFWVKSGNFAIRAIYADGKKSNESPRQIIFTNTNNLSRATSRFNSKVGVNEGGTSELTTILGREEQFTYPKPVSLMTYLISLYYSASKKAHPKDIVVVDFFAGSGTTAEAVIRLNAADGGTRQAILVTNNELSKYEDARLCSLGFAPGDTEYEAMGVFHHVTKPRISTILTGVREDGSTYSEGIEGQSAAFFDLTYEDENLISLGNKFEAIAPLLWMQSGATGELIAKRSDLAKGEEGYSVPVDGNYAVIFDTEAAADAIEAIHDGIKKVFIVTDSENDFKAVTANLPGNLRNNAQRLYSSYLRSFEINRGR
jgi:adenine-specific DNA-methyltransferase